jgi:3',5'-cyclic AMP phosphodiesterase CpdA
MKIAHLSDLHFGRRLSKEKLQAIQRDLLAESPELLVITGDLTDRGTIAQFKCAKEFLQTIGIPFISAPGNREIAATAFLEWMLPKWCAMKRYRNFFGNSDRIVHFQESRRMLFIGLNSVHPLPSWPGRISRSTRYWLKEFAAQHSDYTKILFLHHPVLPVIRASSYWAHGLSDAGEILNICSQTGIELILQGHKHRSAVMELNIPQRDSSVVVSCGGAPLMPMWDSVYHIVSIEQYTTTVKTKEFRGTDFEESGSYEFSRVKISSDSV